MAAQPETATTSPTLPLDHSAPWTEAEFMALPEGSRVELLDGSLLMGPRARMEHQILALLLGRELLAARRSGWRVLPEFDIRVGRDRIFIPDACVVRDSVGLDDMIADASDVALVVEIASPSTVFLDRHVKTRAYAEGGIPRLLRVEFGPDGPIAELSALDDDGGYRLARRAEPGDPLRIDHPFPVEVDLASLLSEA